MNVSKSKVLASFSRYLDIFSDRSVLSIKGKILISIVFIFCLASSIGILSLDRLQHAVELNREMGNQYLYSVEHARQIQALLLELDNDFGKAGLFGRRVDFNIIESKTANIAYQIELLKNVDMTQIEKDILNNVRMNLLKYVSVIKTNIPRGSYKDEQKWKSVILDSEPVLDSIKNDIRSFINVNLSQMEDNSKKIAEYYEASLRLGIIIFIFALVLTALASTLVLHTIVHPINRIIQWLHNYSENNERKPEPLIPVRADELGYLTHSFNELVSRLHEEKLAFQRQTITDELTGLYNYRYLQNYLNAELKKMDRHGRRLAVAMIDIDHFKNYNDQNGHPMGNIVLKDVALILKSHARSEDLVARYGGEEFIIILSEISKEDALEFCERIRLEIENTEFPWVKQSPSKRITISIGIAFYPESGKIAKTLLERADQALYKAKQEGRNRVVVDLV